MKTSKTPPKAGISPSKFASEFTKLVSRSLESLSPEDQDERIKAAERVIKKNRRVVSPKARKAPHTPERREARMHQ